MKKHNIRVSCHPSDKENIQVGGWKIDGTPPAVAVTYKNTTISIEFAKNKIIVYALSEDGDALRELGEATFNYGENKSRAEIPCDPETMFVKDLFGELSEKASVKHCKTFVSGKNRKG